MKVEQISVFLENKSGRPAEVTDVLAKGGLNIGALSLSDTTDFGVLRLIVNDADRDMLQKNGVRILDESDIQALSSQAALRRHQNQKAPVFTEAFWLSRIIDRGPTPYGW